MQERSSDAARAHRPWHLWLVATFAFALYLGGARDYLLILLNDTDYIAGQFGPAGVDYFRDYPPALRLVWTTNLVAGLATAGLLLLRKGAAFVAAMVATLAQLTVMAVTFSLRDRWAALGPDTAWFDLGVAALTAALAVYAHAMRRRGVLRDPTTSP